MVSPDHVLRDCPNCHAWPMPANFIRSSWAGQLPQIEFRCAKCGHEETAEVESTGEMKAIKKRRRRWFVAPIT